VISLTLARKYARAFLEIGLKEGNYETLGKDLGKMADVLRENKELRAVLISAAYPVVTRKSIGKAIGQSLGLSKSTVDFIDILIERGRMDHFPEIAKSYEGLCDVVAKRIRATLVTAVALPPELINEIRSQLESTTGKEVILSVEEDPSLIGGAQTRIGNVIYDGSLKTQLAIVKENLYKE
jgi:F-type H+-transporting ATPase subunit delta